jgi:hypothetical protein
MMIALHGRRWVCLLAAVFWAAPFGSTVLKPAINHIASFAILICSTVYIFKIS